MFGWMKFSFIGFEMCREIFFLTGTCHSAFAIKQSFKAPILILFFYGIHLRCCLLLASPSMRHQGDEGKEREGKNRTGREKWWRHFSEWLKYAIYMTPLLTQDHVRFATSKKEAFWCSPQTMLLLDVLNPFIRAVQQNVQFHFLKNRRKKAWSIMHDNVSLLLLLENKKEIFLLFSVYTIRTLSFMVLHINSLPVMMIHKMSIFRTVQHFHSWTLERFLQTMSLKISCFIIIFSFIQLLFALLSFFLLCVLAGILYCGFCSWRLLARISLQLGEVELLIIHNCSFIFKHYAFIDWVHNEKWKLISCGKS